MGSFEENLWSDLVDEHGSALATAERTPQPGKRRAVPLTLGAFGVAAVAAVAFTATGGVGGAPAAFAVDVTDNGLVSVSFTQVEGATGANERLAELGVRAKAVVADPNCAPTTGGDTTVVGGPGLDSMTGSRFLIDPASIPDGSTLVLVAEQIGDGQVALSSLQVDGPAPACFPSQRR